MLSKKQKDALDDAYDAGGVSANGLPVEVYFEIKAMNEYASFWEDADRYLENKFFTDKRDANYL